MEQQSLFCNHELLTMLRPLVGSWTKVPGTFASHENVKGNLLAKTVRQQCWHRRQACDVALWNRTMWRKFNIHASPKEIVCTTVQPLDRNHLLHSFSDFPHLVKNVCLYIAFDTPEGQVSLQFF